MQGTAADIIKLAMLKVEAACTARRLPAKLIMQVHDELVLEVAQDATVEVAAMLHVQMAAAESLAVPLKVEIGTGSNWDEAH
jgi:DNA polymerase-1